MLTTWKTLRFRLAVWNMAVVAVTALVTLLGLRQGVRWAILHEMDQILIEDTAEIILALEQLPAGEFDALTDELSRKAIGHRQHGWFVQLLDAGGIVVWESADAPADALGVTSPTPSTVDDHRIMQRRVAAPTSEVRSIRVGATLTFLQNDMARIDRLVMLAAGVVLVVAPLLGYWLARRAARTVGDIIHTAARLRPDHLEERLPVRGSGDELDELALTVNALLDRIAIYLEEKRDFLANAAHELRTPLAAIHSSVEVALSSDRTREEYEDLLVDIIDQGAALETLVNQLLLISESEAESLKRDSEPVAFDQIVTRAADMFAGVAESRDLSLEVQDLQPVSVRGNRHLLRQLVNNLIDNAIKYTPAGGRVTLTVTADPSGSVARFCVSDTGIGIPPADIPKIFDRFFRGDRSRTRISNAVGTGLGLSICRAVVLAHRGRIECHSQPGQGTQFEVTLPLSSPGAVTIEPSAATPTPVTAG
jgi:signal transduction histidine kinase